MKLTVLTNKLQRKEQGFTLIELLIVIAILGVLAAALLVAIDPVEQLARGRDSGRKSTVNQLGRSMQAYYTTTNSYATQNATWITTLVTAGEAKIAPANPTGGAGYTAVCTTGTAQNNICYQYTAGGSDAVIYITAESKAEKAKCTSGQGVFVTWSSAAGKTGIACTTNATTEPAIGVTTLL